MQRFNATRDCHLQPKKRMHLPALQAAADTEC